MRTASETRAGDADAPDPLAAALALADRGLRLLPVEPGSKRTALTGWPENATTDPDTLAGWFPDGTDRNLAVALGPSSGVLDIEGDGPDAEGLLADLFGGAEHVPLTPTYTGKRGKHRLFVHPGESALSDEQAAFHLARNAAGELVVDPQGDLEVRTGDGGKGAYSVLPPSLHPAGIHYAWCDGLTPDDVPFAALPAAVLARLRAAERRAKATPEAKTAGAVGTGGAAVTVTEGGRNTAAAKRAGVLLASADDLAGPAVDFAWRRLSAWNRKTCRPPLEEPELRTVFDSILARERETRANADGDDERDGGGRPKSLTHDAQMLAFAEAAGAEPFRDPDGEPHVTFTVTPPASANAGGPPVRQTHRLADTAVRRWLSSLMYLGAGIAPGKEAIDKALNILTARALFEGAARPVAVRVAPHPDGVLLDLGGDDWRGVLVTPDGWRAGPLSELADGAAARFRRPKGLRPLPEPARGGSLDELRAFVNAPDDDAFLLLRCWLVAALRPGFPFPVLMLNGEQGSAKSSTAKALRELIDPNKAGLRRPPKSTEDLVLFAKNAHVLALENLSDLKPDLADDLCSVATGGGFGTRTLYTNDEEALFEFRRPVILNGIPTLADRPDLLDRAIPLSLPAFVPGGARRRIGEAELWAAFEQARPRLLGALLDALAGALANLPAVDLPDPPRMADFAALAVAAEPPLGVPPGAFLAAYGRTRSAAHETALEAEALAVPVRDLAARTAATGEPWEGTPTDLLSTLSTIADPDAVGRRGWPTAANVMSGRLTRIAPDLRAVGVSVEQVNVGPRKKSRGWRVGLIAPAGEPAADADGADDAAGDEGVTDED